MTTTESVYKNRFSGKVAIITGAGSGIGKATITRFVEEGGTAVGVDVIAVRYPRLASRSTSVVLPVLGPPVMTYQGGLIKR
jgi:NADP-dependent 3-hydroxy acid dehydrogenase YdfG